MLLGYLICFTNLISKNFAITLEAMEPGGKWNEQRPSECHDMTKKNATVKPQRLTETVKGAG